MREEKGSLRNKWKHGKIFLLQLGKGYIIYVNIKWRLEKEKQNSSAHSLRRTCLS